VHTCFVNLAFAKSFRMSRLVFAQYGFILVEWYMFLNEMKTQVHGRIRTSALGFSNASFVVS
jgi:hypothetical protein